MGCGGSRTKLEGIDLPLDHWMEPTGVEEFDKNFKEASEIIVHLEVARAKCIDEFDHVVVATGACAHKQPDLEKCLVSFFVNAELDQAEFMKDLELSHEIPYFVHKAKLSAKTLKIHDQIVKFMKALKETEDCWNSSRSDRLKELAQFAVFVELEKQIQEKLKDKKGEL
jgi:hypothetical protein